MNNKKEIEDAIAKVVGPSEDKIGYLLGKHRKDKAKTNRINLKIEQIVSLEEQINDSEKIINILPTENEALIKPPIMEEEVNPIYLKKISNEEPQQISQDKNKLLPDAGPLSTQPGSDDEEFERMQSDKLPPSIIGQDTKEGAELRKLLTGTRR